MGIQYNQLNYEERVRIALLAEEGLGVREIAEELGRAPSTVSRELRRNFPDPPKGDHLALRAERQAEARRRAWQRRYRLKTPALRRYVERKLKLGWSPELIAGRLPMELPGNSISHEAIYLPTSWYNAPRVCFKRLNLRAFLDEHPRGRVGDFLR